MTIDYLPRLRSFNETLPLVIWLTGLPSSGKTTIGNRLMLKFREEFGIHIDLLDGDSIRRELSPDLGFTKEDREIHAKRVVAICKILARNNVSSIVALISPYRQLRAFARSEITKYSNFVEVYVKCSLATCMKRDCKGLYQKAIDGMITDLTGLQSTYEEPLEPDIIVNTESASLEEVIDNITSKLMCLGYLVGKISNDNPDITINSHDFV